MLTVRLFYKQIFLYASGDQISNNIKHKLEECDVNYIYEPESFCFLMKLTDYNMTVVLQIIKYNWKLLGGTDDLQ